MNDNNLFDDNQNTNPFEQNNEPVVTAPTAEETTPVVEETQIPTQQTTTIDMGIDVLNNVGANAPDVKNQIKKSVNKTPFIIIAVILLLSLFVGGTGVAVKTFVFDKAPNKIEVPKDDEAHLIKDDKKEDEEELEEEEESTEQGENEEASGNNSSNPSKDDETGGNASTGEGPTLEETVKKEDKGQSKIYVESFDTEGEAAAFLLENEEKYYEVEKQSNDIVIYLTEAVEGDVEKGTRVEVFRRTFEPLYYEDDEGNAYLQSFMVKGHVSNGYLLLMADYEGDGTYLVMDKKLNILNEGYYDFTIEPTISDEAIYFPKVSCDKKGYKYDIYKLDLRTGDSKLLKTNKFENSLDYCY